MAMTGKQTLHLKRVQLAAMKRINAKYKKGQKEHGGNIWEKAGMLANAEDESTDFIVYLYTLREQLEEAYALLQRETYPQAITKAREIIEKILGKPND
jgi:hypothetical protein